MSERIDRLVVVLGCGADSRGNIGGWKRIKSAISILQNRFNKNPRSMFDYKWDAFLFGPESSQCNKEFYSLMPDFLRGYVDLPHKGKYEPVHHTYALNGDSDIFSSALERFSKDKRFSHEEKREFIMDCIGLFNYLPTNLIIPDSLKFGTLEEKVGYAEDIKTQSFNGWKDAPKFDQQTIQNIIRIYQGINVGIEELKGKDKYAVNIPEHFIKRYDYLYPSQPRKREKATEQRKLNLEIYSLLYLAESGLLLPEDKKEIDLKEEIAKKQMFLCKKEFGKLEYLRQLYEKEIKYIKNLYNLTTKTKGLSIQFHTDKAVFNLSEELEGEIMGLNKHNLTSAYLYYIHGLQPKEYATLLRHYSVEEIIDRMKD